MQPSTALQLYSLRNELPGDFEGTMRKVAQIGYAGVEPYAGLDHQKTSDICRQLGLQIPSSHLPLPLGEQKNRVLDAAATYGIEIIIVPSLPHEYFQSADGIKKACEDLNEAGRNARENGFALGYHNHDFEFAKMDGRSAYEMMLECLDPEIQLQLDTYWVQVGGGDVIALIQNLGDRVPSLHIKDGPGTRNAPQLAIGDGAMDIAAIAQANQSKWWIVELDDCATGIIEAIEKSHRYLTTQGFAKGNS